MYEVALWWLIVEILSLAALPVAAHLFRNLPDKGYGLSKPLGVFLPAFGFWLLSSYGILDNSRASMVMVVAIVGVFAWAGVSEGSRQVVRLWREERRLIVVYEFLFALAFLVWSLIRSYNPDIAATEKPMEIAFLNGVLRSEQFPPVDPWLSGYSISYYYFGYVIVAMLARLSGVASSIAFNLAIALLFALAATGAFSLAYNLATGKDEASSRRATGRRSWAIGPMACGFLGTLFATVMGNLEGLLELLHARAAFPLSFWQWLNIENLDKPYLSTKWYPTDWMWWFRASRVIRDFDPLAKISRDYTINEFPNFSFVLGDLHPHVLALPFTLIAIGLALNLFRSDEQFSFAGLWRRPLDILLWSVVVGGLGFLNSWDLPTYLALIVLAFAVKRRMDGQCWIRESALFGLTLLAASVVLYLPFYLGFSSQVKGLGIVYYRSRLEQFVVFWGPFLFFVAAFLWMKFGERSPIVSLSGAKNLGSSGETLRKAQGATERDPVVHLETPADGRWLLVTILVGILILLALKSAVLAVLLPLALIAYRLLFDRRRRLGAKEDVFATLLILTGMALLAICEVVFVLDLFANRMNTVFKVYYQVWQMLSVASAYVVYCLSRQRGGESSSQVESRSMAWHFRAGTLVLFSVAMLLSIGALVYPVMAAVTKTGEFAGKADLNGLAFMAVNRPGDHDAIAWLNKNVRGTPTILEAAGGSYSQFGRVSAFTGLPTVLGWDGHELQWRGTGDEAGRRKADVQTIYQTPDGEMARSLLKKYDVRYVYVGGLEREAYGKADGLDKFALLGKAVYQGGDVVIYEIKLD